MLSVSFDLAVLAAMLFGIVLPANLKEVDSLNSLTTRPIPGGKAEMVIACSNFKYCLAEKIHLAGTSAFEDLKPPPMTKLLFCHGANTALI